MTDCLGEGGDTAWRLGRFFGMEVQLLFRYIRQNPK